MKKERYVTPEMEICVFETEDVITTSGFEADATLKNGGASGTPESIGYTDLFQ